MQKNRNLIVKWTKNMMENDKQVEEIFQNEAQKNWKKNSENPNFNWNHFSMRNETLWKILPFIQIHAFHDSRTQIAVGKKWLVFYLNSPRIENVCISSATKKFKYIFNASAFYNSFYMHMISSVRSFSSIWP